MENCILSLTPTNQIPEKSMRNVSSCQLKQIMFILVDHLTFDRGGGE